MSERYKAHVSETLYFVTITVVDWIDVFTRRVYNDIVVESLEYCRANKGLRVHAFVIITNHLHLIISTEYDVIPAAVIKDFKRHTSKKVVEAIIENPMESRKEWLLQKFKHHADRIKRGKYYKLWRDGFHPVELSTNALIEQKLEYIHQNPVKAGFVEDPHHYLYSSARNFAEDFAVMQIDPM